MARSFLDIVLRGAEALAARDGVGSLPDADLLRRFAVDRDQAAFAVLVRRHGPLVWGVCRNLLTADADAEDAFQATFVALVRSAGTIRRTDALGGWLHGVAYRVAMRARRSAARRKQRELIAAVPETDSPVPDAAWDELQAAVHDEVCRLPEKLRLPFVLCGLQGRQQKDVAKQLGWKIGTVSGRLTQARQRLLDRLARRGVPVGMAAGAAALGLASGFAAVPSSVSQKAIAAAATPDAVSPSVIALARGVSPMFLTRTKMLVAGVLVAGALTTGIGSRLQPTAEAQGPPSDPNAESIKKAIDWLRAHPTQDRWEYKFLPIEKSLSTADLQKVLSTSDREGWEYCGTQDLMNKGGSAIPHMVFKRPHQVAADNHESSAALMAALAALAAKENENDARARRQSQLDQYYRRIQAASAEAAKSADADRQKADAEKVRAAAQAELQDRIKMGIEAQARDVISTERARADQLERLVRELRAEHEALTAKIKELETVRRRDFRAGSPATESLLVARKYVKAEDALKSIEKVAAANSFKASIDTRSNTLTIHGSPDVVAKLKDLIEKSIDTKPATPPSAAGKPDIAVIKLKHVSASTAQEVIVKTVGSDDKLRITFDSSTNSLIVAGPAEAILVVRKVVDTIDRPGPAK